MHNVADPQSHTESTVANEAIVGMKEVSATIQKYTYPLLAFDDRRRPDLFASCVFIEVSGSVFLVTARHAVFGISKGLMTRGRTHLFDIGAQGGMAQGVNGQEFDIAALSIAPETVEEHAIQVVRPTMQATAVEVLHPHSRAFAGFPVSKNKSVHTLEQSTKTVTTRCYTYFGPPDFAGEYSHFEKSPEIHIGLNYGPGTDDAGRSLTSPPSPKGASGGGAWLVPNFSQPNEVFLEGIVIECHRKEFMFATRIEHVVRFIQDKLLQ
jgi:hypothetical protein